ncbi:DUF2244 domain-containing protein [Oleiagrimonas sp.]|jgi:uncharacterized membrane protein|uniref:DUF2244 domain-containing protein n=1 Tax=Oleiagrimonas sp. TaxID=2010330 RepID=UPI002611FA87|nr:DUF2244 domain-containing protein [Oleiagrimonas sp.]MDA3913079.1 DUF2244 domain-containing protein [Oleiagrimonas sp.]
MIALEFAVADAGPSTLLLRPNRSLSRRAWRGWAFGMVTVTVAIATLGAQGGNVYAPIFALLESAGLVMALSRAWHAGDRSERIRIDARSLDIEYLPGRRHARFQSYWVRVRMREELGRKKLIVGSHGDEVEIGAFLGEEERASVMKTLRGLLANYTSPALGQ